jgi:hypothetical protein
LKRIAPLPRLSIKICSFNLRSSSSGSRDQNKDEEIFKREKEKKKHLKGIEENAISFAAIVMNEKDFYFGLFSSRCAIRLHTNEWRAVIYANQWHVYNRQTKMSTTLDGAITQTDYRAHWKGKS